MTDYADRTVGHHQRERLDRTRFIDCYLRELDIRMCDLTDTVIRGSQIANVRIDGEVVGLVVNGVDVTHYVEEQLDLRYPDRAKMRPTDAVGFRDGWDALERLWKQTTDRIGGFDEELLHRRQDGEWSVIQHLRHLVFATDSWVRRALLGDPAPWDPLDLPHDDMTDAPPVPRDPDARPSLAQVLALRADRMATMRQVVDDVTDERLAEMTEPVTAPGYPEPGRSFLVRQVLLNILNEEWMHRLYIERDLDAVTA